MRRRNTAEYKYTMDDLNPENHHELSSLPTDSISQISWCPSQTILVAGSWDNSVSIWKVGTGSDEIQSKFVKRYHHQAPVLCVAMSSKGKIYSGGCDSIAKCYDLGGANSGSGNVGVTNFGKHGSPIRTIHFNQKINVIVTCSWDKTCKFWDGRMNKDTPVLTNKFPERIYACDMLGNLQVVACGGENKLVSIYDLRKPSKPVKSDKSPLRLQTRVVRVMPKCNGFAIGSIEGRCAVQYFSDGKKSFAFKCHREAGENRDKDHVFAVNGISFKNDRYFSTCGGNGRFCIWDINERRRTYRMKQRSTCSYSDCSFSSNGEMLALAVSYDFSQGTETEAFKKKEAGKILIAKMGK